MGYFIALGRALKLKGQLWWVSFGFAWVLGSGFFETTEYGIVRTWLSKWFGIAMPDPFPIWLLLALYIIWLCASLIHREAMRHWRSGRIKIDGLFVERNQRVNISEKRPEGRVPIGCFHIDIGKVEVKNVPFDLRNGKSVEQSHAILELYDRRTQKLMKEIRHLRWQDNPKPEDELHYPDEWKFRTLYPNENVSTLQFIIKHFEHDRAYGCQGYSQKFPGWCNPDLAIDPGNYIARIIIRGMGAEAAEYWFLLQVGKAQQSFDVEPCKPLRFNEWWMHDKR